MSQTTEMYLITAGGKIRCRRCKARSSRTKLQCAKPALRGKVVCGHHGGYSTGPKSQEGKERIRAAHLKHGQETQEARAERSKKSVMFRYLTDLGNHCDLFYEPLKPLGRPPALYKKQDLDDPAQLAAVIMRLFE